MRSFLVTIAALLLLAAPTSVHARRVAAVQHVLRNGSTPAATGTANAAAYAALASQAAAQGVELVVFPEFGVYGPGNWRGSGSGQTCPEAMAGLCHPVPAVGTEIACANATVGSGDALAHLACLAPQAAEYANVSLSVNLCEAAANGTHYNTQVVLRGTLVVAVYRKRHPWDTQCFAVPDLELVTFRLPPSNASAAAVGRAVRVAANAVVAPNAAAPSGWSRRIGVFTCADILFKHPKDDLVKMGVEYFAYASAIPVAEVPVDGWSLLAKTTVVNGNMQEGWSAVYRHGKKLAGCKKDQGECFAVADLPGL